MFRIIFKILLVLIVFISFVPKDGFCDNHTTVNHDCSLACTTCCGSAVVLPSLPLFLKSSFQQAVTITKYSFLYSSPVPEGLKRPPVFLS